MRGRPKMFVKDSPGPGTYAPKEELSKEAAPGYSMGKDKKNLVPAKPLNINPGPGTYGSKADRAGKPYGFGSSSRMPGKPEGTPGPGHYYVPMKVADVPMYSIPN